MYARLPAGNEPTDAGSAEPFVDPRQVDIEQEIDRQIAIAEEERSWAWTLSQWEVRECPPGCCHACAACEGKCRR